MTIAQRVFRARTVYIVATVWMLALMLFSAAGGDRLLAPDSPVALALVSVTVVITLGTIAFAIWQFVHWARTRPSRPPGRLSPFVKGYVLPAWCAALAVGALTYPVISPTPTADQTMEVNGTVTSMSVHGSGSSTRGDFAVGGQALSFWTDRGYGRLAKGAAVRFFIHVEQGRPKQALDGSVHAYAVEVDGKGVETLQAALRRHRVYRLQIVLLGFLLAALAIFAFRTMRGERRANTLTPEVHVPPPAAPRNTRAA